MRVFSAGFNASDVKGKLTGAQNTGGSLWKVIAFAEGYSAHNRLEQVCICLKTYQVLPKVNRIFMLCFQGLTSSKGSETIKQRSSRLFD